ncbi:hypothetical protein ISCGN_015547 [Ixodes scapularis]
MTVVLNTFQFETPASVTMIGSSKSGKSTYIRKLLHYRQEMFDKKLDVIFYVYVYEQPFFKDHPDVVFTKDIPQNLDPETNSLIIFDDFFSNRTKLKEICEYFIGAAHH